jgi:hypothetical protein
MSSTCRGGPSAPSTDAPPGFRPSVRPPRPTTPPVRQPNLINSNREPLRLEMNVTQTKQTTGDRSNREKEACFFGPSRGGSFLSDPPAFRPRLCRPAPPSEVQSHRSPKHHNSNREALRLETHLTQTKQTTGDHSNREKDACFQTGSELSIVSAIAQKLIKPATSRQYAPSNTRKIPTNPKNTTTTYPSFLLRLRTIPILYFVKFTRSFNRTMLRLERIAKRTKNEPAAGRKGGFSDQRTVRRV